MSTSVVSVAGQGAQVGNVTQTSAATTLQTVTIPAVAGKRTVIRGIVVYGAAAATATLVVQDNGVTILDFGTLTLQLAAAALAGLPIASAKFNQAMQVVVGAASAGATTVSVIADYVDSAA
jgi:hypothetical protein